MVSVKATVMVITLLTFCVLTTNTSAAVGSCCRKYQKARIPFGRIKWYSVQNGSMCPISAIIFHMKKGMVCANPALHWVMDYVKRLRDRATMVHT
uniref:C-C motif chemokine 24-like n=1 Tax=Semicossyphus pulcher TaxID=241346 RepID=UPI0037E957BB